MNRLTRTIALAATVGLGLAATADARDLRVASGAPPPHPATSHLYNGLIEYLPEESGGHTLDVTDWLYRTENGIIMNKSEMRKFGIKVAELVATMRPRNLEEFQEAAE